MYIKREKEDGVYSVCTNSNGQSMEGQARDRASEHQHVETNRNEGYKSIVCRDGGSVYIWQ